MGWVPEMDDHVGQTVTITGYVDEKYPDYNGRQECPRMLHCQRKYLDMGYPKLINYRKLISKTERTDKCYLKAKNWTNTSNKSFKNKKKKKK